MTPSVGREILDDIGARRYSWIGAAAIAVFLLLAPAALAAKPKLSISDAQAAEGGTLKFAVKLSKAANRKVSADYAVIAGTATSADVPIANGGLEIAKGKRKVTLSVGSSEDLLSEGDETFTVKLSGPKGAKLDRSKATGTIVDDDPLCSDSDSDGVCVEDNPPDCNDTDAAIAPGLTEIPGNGIDDDCDPGTADSESTADDDGDGFSVLAGDCNDTKSFIHPNAAEAANGIDDDCDGLVDEGN